MGIIAGDEFDVAVHHAGDEGNVPAQPIKLRDDQLGAPALAADRQSPGQLRPIVPLAAFHLGMLGDQLAADRGQIPLHRFAPGIEAEAGAALPIGADAIVGDKLSGLGLHSDIR
jgi:hypothetical protein